MEDSPNILRTSGLVMKYISVLTVVIAFDDLSYEGFGVVHFILFLTAVLIAIDYHSKFGAAKYFFPLLAFAAVYNPFFRVALYSKALWILVNLATIVVFYLAQSNIFNKK